MPSSHLPYVVQAESLLIVAGEASGDAYGGMLIEALTKLHPHLVSYGVGGVQMRAAGVETLYDIGALNVVGAIEACTKIPQAMRMARHLRAEAMRRGTRVAVLIDAPGFNIPLARQLKHAGLRVVYYVSPQVWAWRAGRVHTLARRIDKMLTLFPFEVPLYTAAGVDAEYVGHPLLERLRDVPAPQDAAKLCGLDPARPIVALLPGSRPNEICRLLPPMLGAWRHIRQRLPHVQCVVPAAPSVTPHDLRSAVADFPPEVAVIQGQSELALRAADFAIIASGTATLQAGFLGIPMVVVYTVHPVTAWLARRLIRIPWIGLVNIVAGKQIVPELVQAQVQPQTIAAYALRCLEQPAEAQRVRDELGVIRRILTVEDGTARAAACVSQFLHGAKTHADLSRLETA